MNYDNVELKTLDIYILLLGRDTHYQYSLNESLTGLLGSAIATSSKTLKNSMSRHVIILMNLGPFVSCSSKGHHGHCSRARAVSAENRTTENEDPGGRHGRSFLLQCELAQSQAVGSQGHQGLWRGDCWDACPGRHSCPQR